MMKSHRFNDEIHWLSLHNMLFIMIGTFCQNQSCPNLIFVTLSNREISSVLEIVESFGVMLIIRIQFFLTVVL